MHRKTQKIQINKILNYKIYKVMKKISLTIATILILTSLTYGSGRFTTFFFKSLDGVELKLKFPAEEEVNEPLPENYYELFKEAQNEQLTGFDGYTFDLSLVSVPEEEIEETVLDTKAIFKQVLKEKEFAAK